MSTVVAAGRRHLPRGWSDLGRQLAIWFGFAVLYQLARGVADRNRRRRRSRNGCAVVDLRDALHAPPLRADASRTSSTSGTCSRRPSRGRTGTPSSRSSGSRVLWVYLRRHDAFVTVPELDPARERDRPVRLHLHADRAAAPARRRLRRPAPRRPRHARRQPVRRDAEPPRRRRADRRRRALLGLPQLVGEGALGGLAALGLVRGDGDRQPLLARLHRRHRRRVARDGGRSTTSRLAVRLPLIGRNRPPVDPQQGRRRGRLVRSTA